MRNPSGGYGGPFRVVGAMSGTSLDGLDLCLCQFWHDEAGWRFSIEQCRTEGYPAELEQRLAAAHRLPGRELMRLDAEYGLWIGLRIHSFLSDAAGRAELIGSHGHTVFHQPGQGFTTQVGSGAHISAATGIPCVTSFRSGDVARGGQGAPLVPLGDRLLFGAYDACLNLGGIANISFEDATGRGAYDICPVNMALNSIAQQLGLPFDRNGAVGESGACHPQLLDALNTLPYYRQAGPKSLGREWFQDAFMDVLNRFPMAPPDQLRTLYEHIAWQIATATRPLQARTILTTGGGARNTFLINILRQTHGCPLVIPTDEIVDHKEALIFAFLALLHRLQLPFCLSSATGAQSDSIGGCLHL